ncbi:hypothetical protein DDE82_000911 [Stemphylium lycopersici]|nr:hypothetical protein DDE82_000911 [Stemphylium lycopersici]
MARGDSLDAPITLEDDDDGHESAPVHVPAPHAPASVHAPFPLPLPLPAVRRRNRQTLDQDDIEEVEHQTAWERAAAQKAQRAKGRQRTANSNTIGDLLGEHHDKEEGSNEEPPVERPPSVKPTAIIDLLTDEDGPTAARMTQQSNSMGIRQPTSHPRYLPAPHPHMLNSLYMPQEAQYPHSSPAAVPFLRTFASAHRLQPVYQLLPSNSTPQDTVGRFVEASRSSASARVPTFQPAPAVPINKMLNHEASPSEPIHLSLSTPIFQNEPVELGAVSVVPLSLQPIRGFADYHRERTTTSRVNTTLERASPAEHADNLDEPSSMSTTTRSSRGSGVTVLSPRQKAIKSVRRRPYVTVRAPPQSPPDDHESASQDHVQIGQNNATPRTRGPSPDVESVARPSTAANPEINLTERPKDRHPTIERLLSEPQEPDEPAVSRILEIFEEPTSNTADLLVHPSVAPSVELAREPEALSPTLDATTDNTPILPPAEEAFYEFRPPENDAAPDVDRDDNIRSALTSNVHDLINTRSAIDACLRRHVAERHESHAYLAWSKMWRQRTFQEQDLRARNRKQKRPTQSTLPEECIQHTSPFSDMPSIQIPFDRGYSAKGFPDMGQEVFIKAKPKDTVVRSAMSVPTTKYLSDAVTIPPFKEYVSLRNNFLADNESKLLATPYFQDEDYKAREDLLYALPFIYELTHDEKGPLDFRKEQCRFYQAPIEAFLAEIGISWNEVLYWLLASDKEITEINAAMPGFQPYKKAVLERSRYNIEEFERDGEAKKTILFDRDEDKWRNFLQQLKEPDTVDLRLAAIACAAILQECEFSIWYLAQQSSVVQDNVIRKTAKGKNALQVTYRHTMCRVCHQHNCLLHGELRQVPEDSWMTDSEQEEQEVDESRRGSGSTHDEEPDPLPAHFHDDSDIEKVINYKLPANPDAFTVCPEAEMIATKGAKPPPGKFNANWWLQRDLTQHWEKRKPFFPCFHPGSCETAQCRCYREGINCEKTCKCPRSCNRRFPGCSCTMNPGKRVCESDKCLCVKFNRECDADLCGSCGATEILDPVNRYNEDVIARNCFNVAIQRGVPRKTLLGHSEVHGFGLYMGEDIEKGEYIGEYTGEAISVKEGDRRLTIYDYQKTMYLFRLNSKQEVDATYMGNKLRSINNADEKYTNCAPKNLLCNTVFRIALFATTNMKAGTELYFNYNYPKEKTAQFKQPNGKIVAVKQNKPKGKKAGSSAGVDPPTEDRSRIIAATAKARAAKAAKRAALMEEEAAMSATRRVSGPLQARKTAVSTIGRKRVSKLRHQGLGKSESTGSEAGVDAEASDDEIPVTGESQETVASQYVEDTDEEDEAFVLERASRSKVAQTSYTTRQRGPGRPRKRASDIAPVVAVKKKGKLGGARPGAGRKRKRPIVANSDDE